MPAPLQAKFNAALFILTFLVPKFHLAAHVKRCRLLFSFMQTPGTGRTDGEGIERGWAVFNPIRRSTREMGPGHQEEVINAHFNDHNWQKIIRLPESLARRMRVAVPEALKHLKHVVELMSVINNPTLIDEWRTMVETWESRASNDVDNPYEVKNATLTKREVEKVFRLVEKEASSSGTFLVVHDGYSALTYVTKGLELEDRQRNLHRDAENLRPHCTDIQLNAVLKKDKIL